MTENFGQWLKAKRKERGLTLRDVERITKGRVSNPLLSQIETGKVRRPSVQTVVIIAAALGLDEADVVRRVMNDNRPPSPEFCPTCGQVIR